MQIATHEEVEKFRSEKYSHRKTKIWGYYNSEINKLITDEKDMLLPIDDRIATRGHGTFDVIYVKKKHIINLDAHVDRLFNSSASVEIYPELSPEQVKSIVIRTMLTVFHEFRCGLKAKGLQSDEEVDKALNDEIFGIRMVMSSGYGDFGIASIDKKPVFYVFVFEPYIKREVEENGVKDYVVKYVKGISNELVHTKTTNYLQNALMANASKRRGGYVGIKAFESGVLLEASIANIAFIFGKQFAAPRMETVIKGTTITKLLKYVEQLKEKGQIEQISFRDITEIQATTASQMIILGGDKIVPVLTLNDCQIGEGKKGKFTKLFQEYYANTNQKLTVVEGSNQAH